MTKKLRFITGFILFVFYCLHSGRALAVSLEDCKARSLKNSDLITAYENLIKSSIYFNRKDEGSLFPQLTAFYQPDYIQFGDRSDLARTHGYETRAGSVLSLDLQKILTDYPNLSRLEVGRNKLFKSIAENEILKDATQNYYRLYILLRKKKDYLDTYDFFQMHIKTIQQLQSKGLDVALDLNRAHVQLESLSISLKNIDNEINDVLIGFNAMMGTSYKEADFSVMNAPDMNISHFSLQNYSSLEQSQLDKVDVNIAKETLEQSRFYYLPTIQLGLEHNTQTVDPNVEEYRTFLALNFNVFDFGQKANERKQLKYKYEYQKNLFKENQKKLKARIEQMINDVNSLQAIYTNSLGNLCDAKKSVEIAKSYYQQGKIKETDLLSVFSDYLAAKDQSYGALYNFLGKKAELEATFKEPDQ